MKWLRKTFLWASVGCLGATTSASAQPNWRQVAVPLANDPAEIRAVTLGRPTPIAPATAVQAFQPFEAPPGIRQATYTSVPPPRVVRGGLPIVDDEPKSLSLPKDLPPLLAPAIAEPVQGTLPPAKVRTNIFELDTAPKPPPIPASTPVRDPSEKIIILDQGGHSSLVDEQGRSLFGIGFAGNQQLYASAEALLWFTRGFHLPPLILTASADIPDPLLLTRGVPGVDPTTRLLYGDNNVTGGPRSGARFTLGYTLDPCGIWSVEGSFFFLLRKSENAVFSSGQFPVLGRPFFDLNNGVPFRELTTSPDQGPGSSFAGFGGDRVDSSSALLGADLNLRAVMWCGCNYQITGLVGFRYLDLDERLSIAENTTITRTFPLNPPDPPFLVGDNVTVADRFNTRNRFYGGQIGAAIDWQRDRWSLEAKAKLGIGVTQQSIDIDGGQQVVSPGRPVQNFVGGLYAVPSNIGHHTRSQFGFVPEVGLKLGYQLTDHVRLFVGYDFLYWSSVVRPGDQIDLVIDTNQVPHSGRTFISTTSTRPSVPFQTTSFWAMGLNAGLEFRY